MARKSKAATEALQKANDSAIKAQEKAQMALEEVAKAQEQLVKAEEEDTQSVKDTEDKINVILEENGLFAGLILSREDLVNLVKFGLTELPKNENIKIGFKLYYNDK